MYLDVNIAFMDPRYSLSLSQVKKKTKKQDLLTPGSCRIGRVEIVMSLQSANAISVICAECGPATFTTTGASISISPHRTPQRNKITESPPIPSMYGIFTYIYHKHQPNVGKYTIHGFYGICFVDPMNLP